MHGSGGAISLTDIFFSSYDENPDVTMFANGPPHTTLVLLVPPQLGVATVAQFVPLSLNLITSRQ